MAITSVIQFGDYIMPIGAKIKTRKIDQEIEEVKSLGLPGTIAAPGHDQAQIVSVVLDMGGGGDFSPTTNAYIDTMDDLNDECNRLFQRLALGYQYLKIGYSPARQMLAQKQRFQVEPLEGSGRTHATLTIDFYAQDPRWLSVANNTLSASGNATNAGNVRTYPKLLLTGAGSNPVLKIQPAGSSGYIAVAPLITLSAGDTLSFDCDPRNRANALIYTPSGGQATNVLYTLGANGITNTVGDDFCFPYMNPGVNVLTLTSGGSTASFSWNDAYAL